MTRAHGALRAGALALVVVAADQASKAAVRRNIAPGESVGVLPGVDFIHSLNTGIAFGLFPGAGGLLSVVAVVVLVGVGAFFWRRADTPLLWLPAGLLVGGAAGNLVDRLLQGGVTDFIDVGSWPAFNVADSAITAGVVTLLYLLEGPPARRRHSEVASA